MKNFADDLSCTPRRTARLELQRNSFTGKVPTEIYNLASLVTLFLGDNTELQGEISPDIAGLVNLKQLNLDRTGMKGALPSEFFRITKLEVFSARECGFTGTMVPEQWLNFTELRELILNFNDFSGPFPNIFNEFSDLELLWLPGNRLTGTLSNQICSARGGTAGTILELVVSANNQFEGCCCDVCDSVEECDALGLDLVIDE
eukprot:scaffold8527_cov187-Amphora_coffeaeformis.AAC.1